MSESHINFTLKDKPLRNDSDVAIDCWNQRRCFGSASFSCSFRCSFMAISMSRFVAGGGDDNEMPERLDSGMLVFDRLNHEIIIRVSAAQADYWSTEAPKRLSVED